MKSKTDNSNYQREYWSFLKNTFLLYLKIKRLYIINNGYQSNIVFISIIISIVHIKEISVYNNIKNYIIYFIIAKSICSRVCYFNLKIIYIVHLIQQFYCLISIMYLHLRSNVPFYFCISWKYLALSVIRYNIKMALHPKSVALRENKDNIPLFAVL